MGGMSSQLLQEAAKLLTEVQVKLALLGTSLTDQEDIAQTNRQMDVVCDAYFRTIDGEDPLTLPERKTVRQIVGRWLGVRGSKVPTSWQKLDPDHVLAGWQVLKRQNGGWEATQCTGKVATAETFDLLVQRVQEKNEK